MSFKLSFYFESIICDMKIVTKIVVQLNYDTKMHWMIKSILYLVDDIFVRE